MCAPAAVVAGLTIASTAVQAGSALVGAGAQNAASEGNAREAQRSMIQTWASLGLRQQQEQDAASDNIFALERKVRATSATAAVSAGESGVSGASVDALLHDISNQGSAAKVGIERNLDATDAQIQNEKLGAEAEARSRINSRPPANPWATALTIGGAVVGGAETLIGRKAPGGK